MNKIKFYGFILFGIFSIQNLYPVEFSYSDQGRRIDLSEKTLKIMQGYAYDNPQILEKYDIVQEFTNKLLYITFDYTGSFFDNLPHGKVKLLVIYTVPTLEDGRFLLYRDYLLLYDTNNQLVYGISNSDTRNIVEKPEITASSEFRENNITYEAKNLYDFSFLKPWVEGKDGSGIGEKIKIEYKTFSGFFGILFSNGFIDSIKPNLYLYNNRVKKIRIQFGDTNLSKEFDLEDTPNYQEIWFDGNGSNVDFITIEILEVYKGTKWDDTCINNIITKAY